MRFGLFLLAFILLGSGCSSLNDRISRVEKGMGVEQVRDVLGTPKERTFKGKREHWAYDYDGTDKRKVVIFENGKVVEMLDSESAKGVMHQADAASESAAREADHCSEQNQWGRFADGGGCNMYGCWPHGGYCNQWGCSSTGRCGVKGCPNKISSFKCKD